MPLDPLVFQFDHENFSNIFGNSFQAHYIYNYLSKLNAKTCINEAVYVDKDYMVDYQRFYSRSFNDIAKFTKRIHFFSIEFSEAEFEQMLEKNEAEKLQASYLGFAVVKPIQDLQGNPLIGRTLLIPFPVDADGKKRFYINSEYRASLFGINLKVKCVPFQVQDRGVSACATVALWTAFQSLPRDFGAYPLSPVEITEIATEFPSAFRMFPQAGLTLGQMINCIRSMGLDVETIIAADSDVVTTAVKAYTYAGIPLIGTLRLKQGNTEAYHAVVIVGYQYDVNGNVTELYVHDDQIGPYSRVIPCNRNFRTWENEWKDRYETIELEELLVPIYHKIRLPFWHIYQHYCYKRQEIGNAGTVELYLTTIQEYKSYLLRKQIREKTKILKMSFPRFIWIERTFKKDERKPVQDDIFDGTAIRCQKLASVEYV